MEDDHLMEEETTVEYNATRTSSTAGNIAADSAGNRTQLPHPPLTPTAGNRSPPPPEVPAAVHHQNSPPPAAPAADYHQNIPPPAAPVAAANLPDMPPLVYGEVAPFVDGFNFTPSDVVLIRDYLSRRIAGLPARWTNVITVTRGEQEDLPWQLHEQFATPADRQLRRMFYYKTLTNYRRRRGQFPQYQRLLDKPTETKWVGEARDSGIEIQNAAGQPIGYKTTWRLQSNGFPEDHLAWKLTEYRVYDMNSWHEVLCKLETIIPRQRPRKRNVANTENAHNNQVNENVAGNGDGTQDGTVAGERDGTQDGTMAGERDGTDDGTLAREAHRNQNNNGTVDGEGDRTHDGTLAGESDMNQSDNGNLWW